MSGDEAEDELIRRVIDQQAEFEKAHPKEIWREGPLYQFVATSELAGWKRSYEAGDDMALLSAVRSCAQYGLKMPDWVATEFIRKYDLVLNCKVKTWDEAFGAPYPKNSNINAMRKRREHQPCVFNRVTELNKQGVPVNDELFRIVGAEMNISASLCRKYYYEIKSRMANS